MKNYVRADTYNTNTAVGTVRRVTVARRFGRRGFAGVLIGQTLPLAARPGAAFARFRLNVARAALALSGCQSRHHLDSSGRLKVKAVYEGAPGMRPGIQRTQPHPQARKPAQIAMLDPVHDGRMESYRAQRPNDCL